MSDPCHKGWKILQGWPSKTLGQSLVRAGLTDYIALVLQNTQCFMVQETIALILWPNSYRLFLSIPVVLYFHQTQQSSLVIILFSYGHTDTTARCLWKAQSFSLGSEMAFLALLQFPRVLRG